MLKTTSGRPSKLPDKQHFPRPRSITTTTTTSSTSSQRPKQNALVVRKRSSNNNKKTLGTRDINAPALRAAQQLYYSSSSSSSTMADDASYNTFLARANQDPRSGHTAEGESTSQARSKFDPSSSTSTNEAIPASLRDIEATYTSDTDAEFEPVFFSYASDALPSVAQFKQVLGIKGENARGVQELSVRDFDPRGEYGVVVGKVEQAGKMGADGKSGVKVFRVEVDHSGTRVEYYVLAVGERSLVGVVAKAVES